MQSSHREQVAVKETEIQRLMEAQELAKKKFDEELVIKSTELEKSQRDLVNLKSESAAQMLNLQDLLNEKTSRVDDLENIIAKLQDETDTIRNAFVRMDYLPLPFQPIRMMRHRSIRKPRLRWRSWQL